jgi:biopolymer transport protein ExbB
MMKMLPERRFRFTAQKALAGGCCLLVLLALSSPALGQEQATAAAEQEIPRSAWLLPFESLRDGEPITWIIVLTSVVAVTLIIQGFLRVRRPVLLPQETHSRIEQLILARQYRELMEFTQTDDGFVSRALNPALKRAPNIADMHDALETGIAEETSEEFRRLEYINILANVGPLLGLLGTVVGIMDAFLAMRRAGGTADVSVLSFGISTALGTTMLGLILAVPCLICYGILRNKADRLTQEGGELTESFFQLMKTENRDARVASNAVSAMASGSASARPVPSRAGAPVAAQAAVARPAELGQSALP